VRLLGKRLTQPFVIEDDSQDGRLGRYVKEGSVVAASPLSEAATFRVDGQSRNQGEIDIGEGCCA
jgi:hypothetical protein